MLTDSRGEAILQKILGEDVEIEPPQSRVEELLTRLLEEGFLPEEEVEEYVRGWPDQFSGAFPALC